MARADRCKHYSGEVYRRGKCHAGVLVRERVGGPDEGWMARMPCFLEPIIKGATKETAFNCNDFALPTQEEMVARKAILDSGAKPRMVGE